MNALLKIAALLLVAIMALASSAEARALLDYDGCYNRTLFYYSDHVAFRFARVCRKLHCCAVSTYLLRHRRCPSQTGLLGRCAKLPVLMGRIVFSQSELPGNSCASCLPSTDVQIRLAFLAGLPPCHEVRGTNCVDVTTQHAGMRLSNFDARPYGPQLQ